MTVREAKLAAVWGIPIECGGIEYNRIKTIIVEYTPKKIGRECEATYKLELECVRASSSTIDLPRNVAAKDKAGFAARVDAFERFAQATGITMEM